MSEMDGQAVKKGSKSLTILLTLCAVVLFVGVAYRMMLDIREARQYSTGGLTLATSGYDLATLTVPGDSIMVSNLRKDRREALVNPGHLDLAELAALNANHRNKYVLSGDRVIGVAMGGQAVAYPIAVLNWHEVVNDELDGQPVLITYCGLTDSAAVYSRQVGLETLTFGFSGLVHSSNTLLYDRRDAEGKPTTEIDEPPFGGGLAGVPDAPQPGPGAETESLWMQLGGVAIAGPLAGAQLQRVPCRVLNFEDWRALYPDTLVCKRDEMLIPEYKQDVYGTYFQTSELAFPVVGQPDYTGLPGDGPKDRAILLELPGGERCSLLFTQILQAAQFDGAGLGRLTAQMHGALIQLCCRRRGVGPCPETVWIAKGDVASSTGQGFIFATYPLCPDYPLLDLATGQALLAPTGGPQQR